LRRRDFLIAIGSGLATRPVAAWSQVARVRHIGVLSFSSRDNVVEKEGRRVFVKALDDFGWKEEQNLQIDYRWADADAAKVTLLAKELVDLSPDVLLASTTPAARALQHETRKIPIVFVSVGDPIAAGLVTSLAHPGGNVTGFANSEAGAAKRVEMLKTIVPRMPRFAAMFNPDSLTFTVSAQRAFVEAARRHDIEPILTPVRSRADITGVIANLGTDPPNGLYVNGEPFFGNSDNRDFIISLCAQHHVPAIYTFRFFAVSGGLISYGNDLVGQNRQAADYIDRILKGTAPADLPVQLPIKQELVINLKTANALNLSIPSSLLISADEVIE
jgi:putative ABC transport system substrate-binding protein